MGLLVVTAMVKEGFYFVGTSADEKRSESWEPDGNFRTLLGDRFTKGEREKTVPVWDSARMYGVANIQSYHGTKECQQDCRIQCERSSAFYAIQAQ